MAIKRIAGWSVVIVVLAAGAVGVYSKARSAVEEGPQQRASRPVPVQVADVERGSIREVRRISGTLFPRAEFTVAPKISGRVQRLYVDIGDVVEKGQVVARLDDDELNLSVEQAEAELQVAEANLAEAESTARAAEREYERIRTLFERNSATESALDTVRLALDEARSRVRVATAQVSQRRSALRAAEVRLSYATVEATWEDGSDRPRVVGTRYTDEGATLSANAPLVSVLDTEVLRAVVFVTERDYPRLSVGQSAVIRSDAWPGERFEGEITRIAPLFDTASRQARVEIRVPNEHGRLKPGMFILAEVLLRENPDTTLLPEAALVRRDGVRGVFVANEEDGVVVFRRVEVGVREGTMVEVLEPDDLSGSQVIVLGQHLVENGGQIEVAARAGVGPGMQPMQEEAEEVPR